MRGGSMALLNNDSGLSVRKNIVISNETENDLKLLSERMNKPQSMIIRELIEEKAKEFKKVKRVEAFKKTIGIASNLIGNKTIQELKTQKDDV